MGLLTDVTNEAKIYFDQVCNDGADGYCGENYFVPGGLANFDEGDHFELTDY